LFNPSRSLKKPRLVSEKTRQLALKIDPSSAPPSEIRIWTKPFSQDGYAQIVAMDEYCYHEGGPLSQGQTEDWDGTACVLCPYHSYAISIENGERFMRDLHGSFKSLGIKQRIHPVHIYQGKIYINVLDPDNLPPQQQLTCDKWQTSPSWCIQMINEIMFIIVLVIF